MRLQIAAALVVAAVCAKSAVARHYQRTDPVPVVVNTVGPYANPSETYRYYSLPFCAPERLDHQDQELGELLLGDRKVLSSYDLRFRVPIEWQELCHRDLNEKDVRNFVRAVDEEYFFELFVDELPAWGYVGMVDESTPLLISRVSDRKHYLYTHLHFSVGYNGDQVVEVNVTTDPTRRLLLTGTDSLRVVFSYSAQWHALQVPYSHRFDRYSENAFLPAAIEVHWMSIGNSLMLVLLLLAFLAVVLVRILRNDFVRYMRVPDEEGGSTGGGGGKHSEEETGWKLIHGDVFRPPPLPLLLAACVGTGAQLLCMTTALLVLALTDTIHPTRRGVIITAMIVLYSLTAAVAGFVSARLYKQLGGSKWAWNVVATALLFPAPLACIFLFLNTTAVAHASTAALPFGTIAVVVGLFSLVAFPLTLLGAIAGRNSAPDLGAPCRTRKAPREVPAAPWYRQWPLQLFLAGFLAFSAIYIELHYIFVSVWGHQIYTLFGILFVSFLLLVLVSIFVTVAATYLQLASEDYRWWWRSLATGGATGGFVLAYSVFYYFNHTEMRGFLQTSFFFGYTLCVAFAAALMLGSAGFYASLFFVRFIYSSIKLD